MQEGHPVRKSRWNQKTRWCGRGEKSVEAHGAREEFLGPYPIVCEQSFFDFHLLSLTGALSDYALRIACTYAGLSGSRRGILSGCSVERGCDGGCSERIRCVRTSQRVPTFGLFSSTTSISGMSDIVGDGTGFPVILRDAALVE